jgi:hypothetical protein
MCLWHFPENSCDVTRFVPRPSFAWMPLYANARSYCTISVIPVYSRWHQRSAAFRKLLSRQARDVYKDYAHAHLC